MLNSIRPCFIIDDLQTTIEFYTSRLGFKVLHKGGGEKGADDFWAFMVRDQVMISFKAITPDIHPQPNCSRHEWARWDAYIYLHQRSGRALRRIFWQKRSDASRTRRHS